MTVSICIGSSCHIKGSNQTVARLQQLVTEHGLDDEVLLQGAFCMGQCQVGVNVTVDGVRYSVSPDTADEFFRSVILAALRP